MALELVVANRNYSSWSMRPWVLLREAGIPFEEVALKFNDEGRIPGVERYSPSGQVPVLLVDGESVWDSLAIFETVAELYPEKRLWPGDERARRLARSICAEMHAGFRPLRGAMPMNIRASHPGKGMSAAVQKDIDRIAAIWRDCRARFGTGGKMLFGAFGAADAMFAPVVTRFATYAVALPPDARAYADAILGLAAVREWSEAARRETEFVRA
ncbi:MAG: glutathione S-transferase family protein, partial [Methylococcaceae bacterium]|nr:glutathione S-transferase family protein [Methylococcaceae bacterium]